MITGIVNRDFEPIIPLSVYGADGKTYIKNAIVDTGFNGWLSLPPNLIAQLNLRGMSLMNGYVAPTGFKNPLEWTTFIPRGSHQIEQAGHD
jgi:predicted aspartyl protease